MMVNTEYLVPMTDANQNFSKVVRLVDESGLAVILKNNKPKYVVVDFEMYNEINSAMQMRKAKIDSAADKDSQSLRGMLKKIKKARADALALIVL